MDKFRKCLRFVSCSTVKERKVVKEGKEVKEEKEETEEMDVEEREEMDFALDEEQPLGVLEMDSILAGLSSLEELPLISENSPWADQMVEKFYFCKSGLRFLKMFFSSLLTLEDTDDAEIRHILMTVNHTREDMFGTSTSKPLVFDPLEDTKHEIEKLILHLQDRIQNCKQKFEEPCEVVLRYSLRCNPLMNRLTVEFLDAILQNLKDLYKFKTDDEILLLNNQIATLEKKVTLLHNLFNINHFQWGDFKEMQAFKVVVHVFAQYSANLVFLYWVKAVDEDMATQLNLLLFDVLQKYKPCVTFFKAVYIRFLEEIKLRQLDSLLLGQIIQIFLDLLLENLVDILKDDFLFFQESLTFVISFLAKPPDEHRGDEDWRMITEEIEVLVKEDLYLVLSVNDINGNFSEANTCLSDFARNVEQVKGKILQAYDRIQESFSYDIPKTYGLGFFDFLLQNIGFLKEKLKGDPHFIPFAKHLIINIEEELMSLRPYLDDLFERQKEQKDLKDIWLKVIDLAYQTEYAINSCSVTGYPLWYNMARLMKVLDEIKVLKCKLKKIKSRKTFDGEVLDCSAIAPRKLKIEDQWTSGSNEVMVGLEDEVDIIVENLKEGSKFLDIVAIVGMAGLGKTTLANKVYNAPAIRHHFHIFAYCIVSQVHNARKILLDILVDIKGKDDKIYDMMEEDLADMLRKCLKGKRYLIIMDDVWDVKAWNEVERSLPNDRNGSRVIFTTRIQNVALQAKKDCTFHYLRFLSEEESWELLRKKAFHAEACPPDFLEVGKMIAKNCKGLPLTIVIIAGLLRIERSLSWWNKISETIGSYVLTEDCMSVLELSYQHLPEHLKPCFLYFGAFVEDTLIRVNKLTLLWIAEGFVQNSNRVNLKNVAKEYLSDLVDRSLVIADKRSSYGGIKSCRIHDLEHEFCQRKAQEENIFQLMVNDEASNSSSSTLRIPYRVCMHMKRKYVGDATDICPNIHSLLFNCTWEIRSHYRYDLSNLKLVQVMDLEQLDCDARFIREMQSVVHLRFMSMSFLPKWSTTSGFYTFTLNDFISNRWNLEILILKGPLMGKLPEAIWNMTSLRHVKVGPFDPRSSGVKKRESYPHPHPQMVNLESFSSLVVSSTEDLEDLLQRSPSLRKLSFHYNKFNHPKDDFHFPKLDSLSKLESLKVESVGEACLRSFNFLSALKKLSLSFCHLDWRYLPVISKLPCLEVLKLLRNSFDGPKWDMEDTEFPKLKFLKLVLLDLAEWIAYVESFPCLEVLIVDECDKLNRIPPCFGEMLTLKRIEVHASHEAAASVVEIQESQKDFGNEELQVIILGQYYRI